MTSLFSLMNLARDGVLTNAAALDVTGQNITGAASPGFVRRTPTIESRATGGVVITGVGRSFDRFAQAQLLGQESFLSNANARSVALVQVEAAIAPPTDDIGERVQALFGAFHELTLQPSDPGVRAVVIARAEHLASGFSEAAGAVEGLRGELFSRARDVAGELNEKLGQLAKVDAQLVTARAHGEPTNDIADTRDQLVRDISERVGGKAIEAADGSLTIFGAGTVLYEGGKPATLAVSLSPGDELAFTAYRGGTSMDITRQIDSGTLGGLREARDVDAAVVLSSLNSFASDVVGTFNAIHTTGYGLDGGTGRPLFTPVASADAAARTMRINPDLAGNPERLAASDSAADIPGGNATARALAGASKLTLAGGGTMTERFAQLASRVGALRSSADAEVRVRQDTVASASSLRESASGVSTDEEMIRLQQFQRGFEAATRVFRVVEELFDDLMRMV